MDYNQSRLKLLKCGCAGQYESPNSLENACFLVKEGVKMLVCSCTPCTPISTGPNDFAAGFLALLVPDYHVGQVKEMSSVGFANISCCVDGVAKIYDITPYFSPLLTHLLYTKGSAI